MLNSTVGGGTTIQYTQMHPPRPTSLHLVGGNPTTGIVLPANTTTTITTASGSSTPSFLFPSILTPTTGDQMVMTPNTIKSIEQSILQTLGEDAEESYMMESQQYSGNFVPPLPSSTSTITLINTWQGGQVSSTEEHDKTNTSEEIEEKHAIVEEKQEPLNKKKKQPPQKRKPAATPKPEKNSSVKKSGGGGGTKEKKQKSGGSQNYVEQTHGIVNEDNDDRRKIRRERNKLAAARCRKRRVDHTNKLVEETEGLEAKKLALQNQITELQSQKEELEFILDAHNCVKKLKTDVQVLSDLQNLPPTSRAPLSLSEGKLKRPNTLNVMSSSSNIVAEHRGVQINVSTPAPPIPINTPSNGIAGLGFEPLCSDWGVNTPTPGEHDDNVKIINVPESRDLSNKCSLVTPVIPYKKLQDL